ncbi:MAG TPA: cytochrome c [Holophagaceae bacterium]|nr:cytochrome c [Holophagaceae bacterium]
MRKTICMAAGLLALLAAGCSRKAAPAPAAPASAAAPEAATVALPGYELRLGKAVFQHYCLNCHGETGAGDGFNAFNVNPHPRDLTDPAFQKAKTDEELADTIRRGGAGVGLSPSMPPWGRTLTADQVDEVVAYVRTLKQAGTDATHG